MTPFQVDVGEQSVRESAKGADTVMPLTETPVVPVFVTQTSLSALVVPTATDAKATLLGDRDTAVEGGGGGGGEDGKSVVEGGGGGVVGGSGVVGLAVRVGAGEMALTVGAV